MSGEHDTTRSWRARAGDKLLNMLGTKFITAQTGMIGTLWLANAGTIDGGVFAVIVLGLAGVQGAANVAATVGSLRQLGKLKEPGGRDLEEHIGPPPRGPVGGGSSPRARRARRFEGDEDLEHDGGSYEER